MLGDKIEVNTIRRREPVHANGEKVHDKPFFSLSRVLKGSTNKEKQEPVEVWKLQSKNHAAELAAQTRS